MENDILAHARQCAPAESCGFVVRMTQGEQYFPCKNHATEPMHSFSIRPEDYLSVQAKGEVIALVHSHPDGMPYLSSADRVMQIQSDLPWWLICEGQIYHYCCVPLLLGRRFEHGELDCYSLIRDAYHLAGIAIPNFSRQDDWWKKGENLYLDNIEATGFYRTSREDMQVGDIVLCCLGSSVANHAAIYCGNSELLHHIPNQLSKRERYSDRWQRSTHSIWRHRAWHASAFTGIYNDLANALTSV
ncbi:phage tail protein [Yersinia kristensenii]|uniref:C40 family peptidase n=1 Tax=Yersinia kristensenii TaxID=28152 RepID=UPI001C60B06B|nr:phage tail protein [Yersinia kristensenii]MBW5844505.1 phage tail protein [Yersinia kristensenii]